MSAVARHLGEISSSGKQKDGRRFCLALSEAACLAFHAFSVDSLAFG